AALRAAEAEYQRAVADAEERYTRDVEQADGLFGRLTADHRGVHEQRWNDMAGRWRQGVADVLAAAAEGNRLSAALFPDWHGPAWRDWRPATAVPPGLRFGEVLVRLSEVPHGLPDDPRLREGLFDELTLPALLPFPNR